MAHILVVDDHADTCEAISRMLTKAGHDAVCVPNGREALSAIVNRQPDLIVLDVRMPVMDGVTFMQVLRSYLRWSDVPVILVTAVQEGPELDRLAQFGVTRVFFKANYSLPELVEYVNELFPPDRAPRDSALWGSGPDHPQVGA